MSLPELPSASDAFTVDHQADGLAMHGCCDVVTAHRLAASLDVLRRIVLHPPQVLDLSDVSFADSHGFEPVADYIRWCHDRGRRTPVLVVSRAVTRLLRALDVRANPFDLGAWDRADRYGSELLQRRGTEPDGGVRVRGDASTLVPSADAATTFIGTIHQCPRCAALEVHGVLDRSAAVLLASMIAGHGRANRHIVFLDTAAVTRVEPSVLDLLADAESAAAVELMISPLPTGASPADDTERTT